MTFALSFTTFRTRKSATLEITVAREDRAAFQGSKMYTLTQVRYLRGHVHMTSAKFSGFLTPSPPCLHFGPIHSTKFTQPPLLHLLLGYPPSPLPLQTSYVHAPKWIGKGRKISVGKTQFCIETEHWLVTHWTHTT